MANQSSRAAATYTTSEALDFLCEKFGEPAIQHLLDIMHAKSLWTEQREAAIRVAAKRTTRGADYAGLVKMVCNLPHPVTGSREVQL